MNDIRVKTYKGKYIYRKPFATSLSPLYRTHSISNIYDRTSFMTSRKVSHKVIVFDLDETLGCFADLNTIWNTLFNQSNLSKSNPSEAIKQDVFNHLLDLYPEFFRPHIFQLLKYIYKKIEKRECDCIYLYTNNQCKFPEWTDLLLEYMTRRVAKYDASGNASPPLFAKPVCAFKINNTVIEHNRTTHEKTHSDFIACTLLPKQVEICFMDDKYYAKIVHDKVYYIQPPPYYHTLTPIQIMSRFQKSELFQILRECGFMQQKDALVLQSQTWLIDEPGSHMKFDIRNTETHQTVHNKIMFCVKEFFLMSSRKEMTKKHNVRLGRFTKRRKHGGGSKQD